MAMGIVSDEEFEKEFERVESSIKHIDIIRGRNGARQIPEAIREQVAEDLIKGGKLDEVTVAYGISQASASAYKNGATSTATYNEPNEKLQKHNDTVRLEISASARARLKSALDHITEDKLKEAKLRDLSTVARDMSTIVNTVEPQISGNTFNSQFVFHVPAQKSEREFEVIDVE